MTKPKFEKTIRELRLRVLKGIRLLDDIKGKGWVQKVKVSALNIKSNEKCVCGQLYGDFWDAVGSSEEGGPLGVTFEDFWRYGFDLSDEDDDLYAFDLLNSIWVIEITKLQLTRNK